MSYLDKDLAIQVKDVSKQFYVGALQQTAAYRTLRDTIGDIALAPFRRVRNVLTGKAQSAANLTETMWALQDINFNVKRGEVVGIIGHNGAGKSTLLKVLSRVTEPTTGEIRFRGRLGSLLEVGTGFHPELSGRENIYLNGAILGMTRHEITSKFDEIVEFAGVERFIDTPVKHYSSGMYVRLAFAVAAHLEPEILVIDEVLSVGDAAFQRKSLGKMQDVADSGRTVLFVSHNMAAVQQLCSRSIVLSEGRIAYDGETDKAVDWYLSHIDNISSTLLSERTDRAGSGILRFTNVEYLNTDGNIMNSLQSGQTFDIRLYYQSSNNEILKNVRCGIKCRNQFGINIFTAYTKLKGIEFGELPAQSYITCRVYNLPLPPSTYKLELSSKVNNILADKINNASELTVVSGNYFGSGNLPGVENGLCLVQHDWSTE